MPSHSGGTGKDVTYPDGSLCSLVPLRFLCDEMLRGVGDWLRIAGYDTLTPPEGVADETVLEVAIHDNRWLITRDRGLYGLAGADHYVILLQSRDLQSNLQELAGCLDIDWLYRPFSRCKSCNTALVNGEKPSVRHRIPPDIANAGVDLRYCPACDQFFWEGSHVRRMQGRLIELSRLRP
jgi:uncharacterized protein with PIN domain